MWVRAQDLRVFCATEISKKSFGDRPNWNLALHDTLQTTMSCTIQGYAKQETVRQRFINVSLTILFPESNNLVCIRAKVWTRVFHPFCIQFAVLIRIYHEEWLLPCGRIRFQGNGLLTNQNLKNTCKDKSNSWLRIRSNPPAIRQCILWSAS